MTSCRTVVVKQLPESVTLGQVKQLAVELAPLLSGDWPCLVFDFSEVRELDRSGVEMLLHSMESAMKRNGDVKLSAVPPQVGVILGLTGVDRLFQSFQNTADAIESFHRFPAQAFPRTTGAKVLSMAG
jgi:anti-anti-sigma regulatory factor